LYLFWQNFLRHIWLILISLPKWLDIDNLIGGHFYILLYEIERYNKPQHTGHHANNKSHIYFCKQYIKQLLLLPIHPLTIPSTHYFPPYLLFLSHHFYNSIFFNLLMLIILTVLNKPWCKARSCSNLETGLNQPCFKTFYFSHIHFGHIYFAWKYICRSILALTLFIL
jgi:hypothetical protein